MEKLLGKKEKIFMICALVVINIFCVVKFFISFVRECSLISYLKSVEYEGYVNFNNLNSIKIVMILGISLAILLFLFSFFFFAIKSKTVKKNFIVISTVITLLITIFFFVTRFTCGDLLDMYLIPSLEVLYMLEYNFCLNGIYMILSAVFSIIACFLNFSLSNDIYEKENKKEIKTEEALIEDELSGALSKLKAQIRIKKLESEYMALKAELDKQTIQE